MKEKPWITYPDLSEERLVLVAQLISKARQEVALLFEPEKGDMAWDRGCRAYSRTRFALREAAQDKYSSWLSIVDGESSLEFTFKIGAIPFKFCKADGDDIPSRYLQQSQPEAQGWLAMEWKPEVERTLRIAIETSLNGEAARIALVELTNGTETGRYSIPESLPGTKSFPSRRSKTIVLPPVPFGLKKNESRQNDKREDSGHR